LVVAIEEERPETEERRHICVWSGSEFLKWWVKLSPCVVKHSALEVDEWSVLFLNCSIPWEGAPAYHRIGGRVGPMVGIP
jgi:hypothetical protein